MADWVYSPVHDHRRSHQLDLRFPHFRGTALVVPSFHECAAIPYRMVRGIPGNTNARSVRDPDGRQSSQEPPQPTVGDQRVSYRRYRHCPAVYTTREPAGVYPATAVLVGRDCASCRDLPLAGSGCEVLVLPPTRAALIGLGASVRFPQHYGVYDVLIENSHIGQRHHKTIYW